MNALTPMLTVRAAGRGDAPAIRAFLAARSDSTPFHLPEWAEAVEAGCGHRDRSLVAVDERGAVAGLLPMSEVRSPLFGSALVSSAFGIGGGAIGEGVESLAEQAWALAQGLGCDSVELRGGRLPAGWERREGVYATFSRHLEANEEAILKAIPRKQRAEVRRAMGLGLETRAGRDLDAHYRVYSESVRNLGTPVFPRRLFEAALERLDSDILTVSRDGRPLASVLTFYHGGCAYPYWGGGTAEARTLRANELLYYALMCHAARRGCTRFDFGRSKLGTGAFAFKKNWGFEPEPLVYAVRGKARETNPLSPRYRLQVALWRKLPLPVANRLGPLIAKGLG
jgi:FemAB-related protein (PEP-CTERM system-associated)